MDGSVQLCDFIWQHECRKRWITYKEEELTILNKAIGKKQKTVKLPSSNIKKEIIVHLDKMYQKNQITSYEQRIRCGVYNNGFYSWSWLDDDGYWYCYPAFVVLLLEIAYEQKKEKLSMYLNGDLEIDLINFVETNEETRKSRRINRDCLEIPLTSAEGMMITESCKNHVSKMACEVNLSQSFVLPEVSASARAIGDTVQSSIMTVGMTPLNTEEEISLGPEDLKFIPVDSECQEHEKFHLYFENGVLFTATLNLTSLQKNNNKFYIIQLLEHNKRKQYCVWRRWGRVGSKGQSELVKYGSNIAAAKEGFEKKFFDKTNNNWNNKSKFVKRDGKYDLLKIDLSSGITVRRTATESKLDPNLQSLLNLICDKKLMEEVMKEMNYDSKRTPLGNLTTSQIHAGYAALSEIVQLLNSGGKGSALVNACNNFYTKIPHDFGRKTPTIITTIEEVQEKLKMLEALGNINVAMNVMDERMDIDEDPLDKYYKKLKCHLTLLDHSSEEFVIIENCIQTTHGPTHNSYSMTVIDIFSCRRELESASFLNYGNVMLLWHGSRLTNWLGILKEGLQIAPRKELITGSLFGKGIYFADVSSKSANYCKATKKNDEGLLLLCEVSLGQQLYLYENENINLQLPEGYHSVAGIGSIKPSSYHLGVLSTEAKLPGGPLIEENVDCYLKYNEYVVYNPKQVKMRYLVRVKFNFK